MAVLSKLKPAFQQGGSTTAGGYRETLFHQLTSY